MMTNGQRFESLTKEEKLEFLSMYMEHPLVKYIDWKTFYDSTDGNSMHFVNYIDKYEENEDTIYVLECLEEDGFDYIYVYNETQDYFEKIPNVDYLEYIV